jgi:hypothetical protein
MLAAVAIFATTVAPAGSITPQVLIPDYSIA